MENILKEHWDEVGCVICGPESQTVIIMPHREHGNTVKCNICGLIFRSPRKREKEQLIDYEESWTEEHQRFLQENTRKRSLSIIADWILKRYASPATILDIGCSYGNFLSLIPETWHRFGVEPSRMACNIARRRLPGVEIINGDIGTADLPHNSFDVITLIATFHLMLQPLRDLNRIKGLLKEDGILVVECQNFANRGVVYRLLGESFPSYFMYFYTPITLMRMLQAAQLRILDRIDLPGFRIDSPQQLRRLGAMAEFLVLKTINKLTFGLIDLMPRFAMVAQRDSGIPA